MTRARRKPLDPDLYAAVVDEAKARFAVWPSAYASGWVVKTYKERGGRYGGESKGERTGLTKWFGEEWVDLSRPTADGGYEPCGRKGSDAPFDAAHYPKCRPLREALRMSPDEVKDAVRRKRRAEAQAHAEASAPARGSRARSPKRVATYRKNPAPDTEAFRRWFGDSKVVDERGEPLVVYHGSPSAIVGGFRQSQQAFYGPDGIYFTNRRDVAEHFGEHVTSVFLSLQNPYYDDGSKDVGIQSLRRKGYDGIVCETDFLDEDADGELMLVVFHPEQVRRADLRANPLLTPEDVITGDEAAEIEAFADAHGKQAGFSMETAHDLVRERGDHVLVRVPVGPEYLRLDSDEPGHEGIGARRTREYAQLDTEPPPIRIGFGPRAARQGLPSAVVWNGNHRVRAARLQGRPSLLAMMPVEDFHRWQAALDAGARA
jgi:hypothetical protein